MDPDNGGVKCGTQGSQPRLEGMLPDEIELLRCRCVTLPLSSHRTPAKSSFLLESQDRSTLSPPHFALGPEECERVAGTCRVQGSLSS